MIRSRLSPKDRVVGPPSKHGLYRWLIKMGGDPNWEPILQLEIKVVEPTYSLNGVTV